MICFTSDNVAGVAPEIEQALQQANLGPSPAYGADPFTQDLQRRFTTLFEKEVDIFPVLTGTAGNCLALATLCPPYGAILCHKYAHIIEDECGAPEFFTGGARVVGLEGESGKIDPQSLHDYLISHQQYGSVHAAKPMVLSLSQVTEAGTVYSLEEIRTLTRIAKTHGLWVHMDGARFANALVALNCSLSEMTWRAGVDVLTFGATKNGCWAAEAVIFFQNAQSEAFSFRRKKAGHLISKMRFISAQLEAYLKDGLWLRWAEHANRMAKNFSQQLQQFSFIQLCYPVEANEIFIKMPAHLAKQMYEQGFYFADWPGGYYRLVTSFRTIEAEIDAFISVLKEIANKP
jgi:threonine aldolase